jgi:hypothetical protein
LHFNELLHPHGGRMPGPEHRRPTESRGRIRPADIAVAGVLSASAVACHHLVDRSANVAPRYASATLVLAFLVLMVLTAPLSRPHLRRTFVAGSAAVGLLVAADLYRLVATGTALGRPHVWSPSLVTVLASAAAIALYRYLQRGSAWADTPRRR